jgi:CheY-like chemotaxis protein
MPLTGNVIIVDDEPHVRLFLSLVVRGLGPVTINEAPNGRDAVALFRSLSPAPNLILLDVNMPGMDGIETLRQLRAEGARCPIVMLTSLATRQRVEEALASGADHYLRKDTPRTEIASELQSVLDDAEEQPSQARSA